MLFTPPQPSTQRTNAGDTNGPTLEAAAFCCFRRANGVRHFKDSAFWEMTHPATIKLRRVYISQVTRLLKKSLAKTCKIYLQGHQSSEDHLDLIYIAEYSIVNHATLWHIKIQERHHLTR